MRVSPCSVCARSRTLTLFAPIQLVKYFKKEFACNGTVVQHPEYGEVAQLQGDQRNNICSFLVREGLVKKDKLKVCVCAAACG